MEGWKMLRSVDGWMNEVVGVMKGEERAGKRWTKVRTFKSSESVECRGLVECVCE